MVAVEPILDAVATPIRYGRGFLFNDNVISKIKGVNTTQMVSFKKRAESIPADKIV